MFNSVEVHGENKDTLKVKVRGKLIYPDFQIERENNIKIDIRELSGWNDVATKMNCIHTWVSYRSFLLSVTKLRAYFEVAY
jgi:hypothetical protein